jgi:tetratricopeptide (TPR) repeat protein
MNGFPWNDSFDLSSLHVEFSDVSLLFVLWQFHIQKASGEISIKVPRYSFELLITSGKVQGFRGVPKVLSSLGIENLPGSTLEDLIGMAMSKGISFEDILGHAAKNLGVCLYRTSLFSKGTIIASNNGVGRPMELPMNIPSMIVHGIQDSRSDNDLMREYASKMRKKVTLYSLKRNPSQMSLPMKVLKLYRKIKPDQRLSELVPHAANVTTEWRSIDILHLLNLISFTEVQKQKKVTTNDEALQRYKDLRETLQEYKTVEPHVIFELKNPNEVNDIVIDQRFRELSKRYHPDRFIGEDRKIIAVVKELYGFINETHSGLQGTEYREKLILRLEAEHRGEQYVSPEEVQRAQLLHAQAQFLFRKRKYEDAKEVLLKAHDMDPYNWRIQALKARVLVLVGEAKKIDSAEVLLNIKNAKGIERVDLLFNAAEMLFQADEKERAYELFETVINIDESHIDAKRYIQRRSVNNKKQNKKVVEKKGFFSSIFSKRK